jgi:hypothetical protein
MGILKLIIRISEITSPMEIKQLAITGRKLRM